MYESLVMPFGLTNAPATFQHFINDTLRPFLDLFCSAYLDNIIVYSDTLENHKKHVTQVLEALSRAGIHLKPEKCVFHANRVEYLVMIVSAKGVEMDPGKIKAVVEWETPRTVKEVQAFLGFANFYRCFIKDCSHVVTPLTEVTRKDTAFEWAPHRQQAFDALQQAFTSASIL